MEELQGFDDFWKTYPRRVGKGDAKKAWRKIRPDAALVAQMIETIRKMAQCEQWQRDGGQFIPHPATWLHREGWEDCPVIEKVAPPPRQFTACITPGCKGEGAPIWKGKCAVCHAQSKPARAA